MAGSTKKSSSKKTSGRSNSKFGPSAGESALNAAIQAGKPDTLYFFYGEEDWLRDEALQKLKDLLLTGGMDAFNLRSFHGSECTPEALSEAVDCLPMLSEHTMIVVYDYDVFKANQELKEKFADILENLPDYLCLVFLYDLIGVDGRTTKGGRLGKLAAGRLVEFKPSTEEKLADWVAETFRSLDKGISDTNARHVIHLCGNLRTNLSSEIHKIAAYAKGASVTREDIETAATPILDAVAFTMTTAMTEGRFDDAAKTLSELFSMQEDPIKILGAVGWQLRQLYLARLAVENNKSAAWLGEQLGGQSWRAGSLMRGAKHFSGGWYRSSVKLVGDADRAMKLSFQDGNNILIELLAKLAEAAQ